MIYTSHHSYINQTQLYSQNNKFTPMLVAYIYQLFSHANETKPTSHIGTLRIQQTQTIFLKEKKKCILYTYVKNKK